VKLDETVRLDGQYGRLIKQALPDYIKKLGI
jgi:hypothetical protein